MQKENRIYFVVTVKLPRNKGHIFTKVISFPFFAPKVEFQDELWNRPAYMYLEEEPITKKSWPW